MILTGSFELSVPRERSFEKLSSDYLFETDKIVRAKN